METIKIKNAPTGTQQTRFSIGSRWSTGIGFCICQARNQGNLLGTVFNNCLAHNEMVGVEKKDKKRQ